MRTEKKQDVVPADKGQITDDVTTAKEKEVVPADNAEHKKQG
jgi:hypothetical protein